MLSTVAPELSLFFLACSAFVLIIFLVYPLSVRILSRGRSLRRSPETPPLTIIVPTYNEEVFVEAKVRNLLESDYPREGMRILIVDNGSTDRTVEIANTLPVEVLHSSRGKVSAINRGLEEANTRHIVVTDADVTLDRAALKSAVSLLGDGIGAVSGTPQPRASGSAREGRRFEHVRREFELRHLESRLHSACSLDGRLMVFLRDMVSRFPPETLADDYELTFLTLKQGKRAVVDRDAHVVEERGCSFFQEIHRIRRWFAQGFITSWRYRGFLWNRDYPYFGRWTFPFRRFFIYCVPLYLTIIVLYGFLLWKAWMLLPVLALIAYYCVRGDDYPAALLLGILLSYYDVLRTRRAKGVYPMGRVDTLIPMKLALVYPWTRSLSTYPTLKAQDRNMGIIPPLNLCYVAAVAERAGWQVAILDAAGHRLSQESVARSLREFGPDLLGFTLATDNFHQTLAWIEFLKRDTGVPVIVGGVHVGYYPRETMRHACIDYALVGEAEVGLPAFLRAFQDGRGLDAIGSLCHRSNGEVSVPSGVAHLPDVDEAPLPARHLLDNSVYDSFLSRRRNFTAMITSRGCPFRCIFCSVRGKPRLRSASSVLDEMEACNRKHGIREIDIYDATFSVDPGRVREICDGITGRGIDVIWSVRTRIDLVDEDLLRVMGRAGCRVALYGIESADPGILRTLKKDIDLGRVREIVEATRRAGIAAFGFFILGSPGETLATIRTTIRFAKRLGLDYVQFSRLTPFPASEYYEMYVKASGVDSWREYVLDPRKSPRFEPIGTSLTGREVAYWVKRAYLSFYFDPRYIARALLGTRSLGELRKGVRAAWDMLWSRQHREAPE